MSNEYRLAVSMGQISAREAAEQASAVRNQIMEMSRLRSSPAVRAYATKLKKLGLSFSHLQETYAQRKYGTTFSELSEGKQSGVYAEIIRAAGRPDPGVMELAEKIGRVGRRVLLVSLAIAVYEVAESDDKPREVARQGALASAGVIGGWAAGTAAVAAGMCAATAPVCVGVAAFAGGLLAAFGADSGFGALYPRPSR